VAGVSVAGVLAAGVLAAGVLAAGVSAAGALPAAAPPCRRPSSAASESQSPAGGGEAGRRDSDRSRGGRGDGAGVGGGGGGGSWPGVAPRASARESQGSCASFDMVTSRRLGRRGGARNRRATRPRSGYTTAARSGETQPWGAAVQRPFQPRPSGRAQGRKGWIERIMLPLSATSNSGR